MIDVRRLRRLGAVRAEMPGRIAPQLAVLAKQPPATGQWSYEIKFDGYRLLSKCVAGVPTFYTRNGHDWTDRLPALADSLGSLPVKSVWLDGEAVVLNESGLPDFSALQNAFARRRTSSIVYFVFDLLYLDGFDLRHVALHERRDLLRQLLAEIDDARLRFSNDFEQDVRSLLDSACRMQLEGIVGKRADATYTEGRSPDWVKLKCRRRQEFVVGAYTQSRGARSGVRGLLLGVFERDGSLRYAGAAKAELRPKQLQAFAASLHERKSPPFLNPPARDPDREVVWVEPEKVVEVSFLEWTPVGEIRQGVMVGLREDKDAREVREEGVDLAMSTGAGERLSSGVRPVRITNPGRIIDPSSAVTKRDLISYYEAMADLMLPQIGNRPLMLVRAPDGISGALIYQKHAESQRFVAVESLPPSLHPGHAPLLVANTPAALVELAQLNVVEIHCWNASAPNLASPDQFILDLDPDPALPWRTMREAAMLAKVLLDEIGLESFCKTSGGKGLHLVIPLRPIHAWDEVKRFSHAIARHLARVVPERFSAVSGPRNRVGKVFVDYLRNGRGSTTAAAYSVRARPGLGVSVPISWDELGAVEGGDQWNVRTARQRRDMPWGGIERQQVITKQMTARLQA